MKTSIVEANNSAPFNTALCKASNGKLPPLRGPKNIPKERLP
jgi:hypothetical protein